MDNLDIREQFPLDRDITLEIACDLGVRHPYYPRTNVPTVMTLDFLVTRVIHGKEVFVAYSVKEQEELNDPRVVEKLEIERMHCSLLGIAYYVIVKEHLPMTKVRNLLWLRNAQLNPDAVEEFPGFYKQHQAYMVQDLAATHFTGSLADYCTGYDRRNAASEGTGLRVARMLLANRTLAMDLNNPAPERAPLSSFVLSAAPGRLRSVGGA